MPVSGFETGASIAMSAAGEQTPGLPVWEALGAYGAALCGNGPDLLSPERRGSGLEKAALATTKALAALTALLALGWPSAVALKTQQDLRRLDTEIASLRPAVERVEGSLALLGDIEARVHILRETRAGNEEPLRILRDLTDALPQGTWLTGLRVEDRRVEIDGLSPSANEIFPLLSRDGRFRKVEFASPITRQADNLERFQIRAEYSPSPPAGQEKVKGGKKP
jgi:Tfp pilus assembly protein PilN